MLERRQRQRKPISMRLSIPLLSLGMLLFLFTSCGPGTATNTQSNGKGSTVIRVATDLPVSGQDTANGKPAQNGAEMAVNEANQQNLIPGYRLEFVPKDDVGPQGTFDPDVGKTNITQLINDALVTGVVGPFNSSVAQAEMPVANQAPIALISPSNTNTCLTQRGAKVNCSGAQDKVPTLRPTGKVTYFRIATTDDHQGSVLADYLYQHAGYKKAYVIDDTTVYGIGLANIFSEEWQKLGGTLVGARESKKKSNDYGGTIANIKSAKPDLVFYGGTDSQGGTQLRQQLQTDSGTSDLAFAGGDGIENPSFAQVIGTRGGPTYATIAKVNETVLPSAKTFIERYNKIYGENNYGAYSAAGYDCMNILIQAIKRALDGGAKTPRDSSDSAGGTTFREAVIEALKKTDYNGVTGHQAFNENGDTTNKVISVWQIANVQGKDTWKFVDQIAAK